MDFTFLPLEIWRASSLAQETKAVVAAFDRAVATGDAAGLASLKSSILRRIEDLEQFYVQNVDDDRSVLFEKQRLKLRKLLADYGQASASVPAAAPSPAVPAASYAYSGRSAAPAAPPAATTTRYQTPATAAPEPVYAEDYQYGSGADYAAAQTGYGGQQVVMRAIRIAEDTRLSKDELVACFAQALGAEMPEVSPDIVERVYETVTKTNLDGKMSVRDLRQWYISFGKRALREGIPLGADASIVSPALVAKHGFAHSRKASKPTKAELAAAATAKTMYAWEAAAAAATSSAADDAPEASSASEPVSLPHGMLEFQVRLSPDEWSLVQLKRRQMEAEERYRSRVQAAKDKDGKDSSGPKLGYKKSTMRKEEPSDAASESRSGFLYSSHAQNAHVSRFYNGSPNE